MGEVGGGGGVFFPADTTVSPLSWIVMLLDWKLPTQTVRIKLCTVTSGPNIYRLLMSLWKRYVYLPRVLYLI